MTLTPQKVKLIKDGFKLVLALGTSVLLGTIYKAGKEVDEKLDAYFDEHYPQPEKSTTKK
jgi:hypothetical protein